MSQLPLFVPLRVLAQQYGCDTYGQSAYNTCSTTTTSPPSSRSQLADTGITVGIFIAIAAVVIGLALLVRFWRRKKSSSSKAKTDE